MKRCAHCKEFKPEEEFAYSNQILKTRQKHCRNCMKEFNRKVYERRSEDKKEQVKSDKLKRIAESKQFIWDYLLTHPCVQCGEKDPVVLEFDHIKGRKVRAVSDMAILGYSIDSIREEIGKCQVLCANCHRRKTHQERGWFEG